ncbi:MAG: helix-turn-helix domain-containing protein [Deltaproteobacteria bacterium]|nr:helix-turn-helix domain-containing protein [Deltaproteobacteria bacterium]
MKFSGHLTDDTLLAELGARLARRRLELQRTQAEIAEKAGIAKRTLERIEAGHSAQMSSVIRLLRVLDLLSGLEDLVPEATPRPMALLKDKGKIRQRASRRHPRKPSETPWTWGNES